MKKTGMLLVYLLMGLFLKAQLNSDCLTFAPNPGPMRTMADWEEIEALLLTWAPSGIYNNELAQITAYAQEECEVWIVCEDSTEVKTRLLNHPDIDNLDRIYFYIKPYNSVWVRDFGPVTTYKNKVGERVLVDWTYNRTSRKKDDTLSHFFCTDLNYEVHTLSRPPLDLVHTGGNFLTDGINTSFSSNLLVYENAPGNGIIPGSHDEEEIRSILNSYMGIGRTIILDSLWYDKINHLDMQMMLLDEETLLVGQYPPGVADHDRIENNIKFIKENYLSAFGSPYRIVRIPMPPDQSGAFPPEGDFRTYTNLLFLNNKILLPRYNSEEEYEAAKAIIQAEAPGYEILPVACSNLVRSFGAIHCVTKGIGVEAPLHIVHQRIRDQYCLDIQNVYPIEAKIYHQSGIESATVYYKRKTESEFEPLEMESFDGETYVANIPGADVGETIEYYLVAQANSGKTMHRPYPAPEGFYEFKILPSFDGNGNCAKFKAGAYPNPTQENIFLNFIADVDQTLHISLYDVYGQMLGEIPDFQILSGNSTHELPLGIGDSGTYFLHLRSNTIKLTIKIVVVL